MNFSRTSFWNKYVMHIDCLATVFGTDEPLVTPGSDLTQIAGQTCPCNNISRSFDCDVLRYLYCHLYR